MPSIGEQRVLAVSLSGAGMALGLSRSDQLDMLIEPGANNHSARLMPAIDSLLSSVQCAPTALTGIVLDAGPGGFTRIRVACAAAQGLAAALNIPIACVDSLQALALAWTLQSSALQGRPLVIAIDARMGAAYAGVFRATSAHTIEVIQTSQLVAVDALPEWLQSLGHGADLVIAGDQDLPGCDSGLGLADASCQIRALCGLAGSSSAPFVPAAQARPHYVRDKVALNISEQAQLRARRDQDLAG